MNVTVLTLEPDVVYTTGGKLIALDAKHSKLILYRDKLFLWTLQSWKKWMHYYGARCFLLNFHQLMARGVLLFDSAL